MSAEESGTWQVRFEDADGNNVVPGGQPIAEFTTQQTSSAAKGYPADRDALALPLMPPSNLGVSGTTGGKVSIYVKSDAATDTVESEESNGHIPFILVNEKTGARLHRTLRLGDDGSADFAGFNGTDDVTLVSTDFRKLGSFSVPAGFVAMPDGGKPVHLFLGDDT